MSTISARNKVEILEVMLNFEKSFQIQFQQVINNLLTTLRTDFNGTFPEVVKCRIPTSDQQPSHNVENRF